MYKTLTFDLGRNALRYLIKTYDIKEINIPYYLCDVIRHTLVEEGCKPVFYHIDDNFYPYCEFNVNDFILYPNYWGICRENTKKLAAKYPKLVVDNAHAYYDEPSGFACFNAGHKFGFKDSYLWIKYDTLSPSSIDKINSAKVSTFPLEENAKKRKEIFLNLHNEYKNINLLKIDLSSVPFCYPCLTKTIKEADELVKSLKGKGKTVYRYWSPLPRSFCEYKFYSRLVPIPILPLS